MRERVLPWLLVLPALVFATPLSPLADDLYPHLAGTGWAVLALVPLALFVLVRGSAARGVWPFLLAGLWALVAWRAASVTDTFEARRALCGLAVLPLAFAGGAALGERGRRSFEALLVALSLAWTGLALLRGSTGATLAGVLGDTGSLSQAALPGAAIGAVWLASASGARRVLGALALLLFLVHVGAAPVIAGSHTLLAALLLGAWRHEGRGRVGLLVLAGAALLAPFLGMAARQSALELATFEGAARESSHSLSGLGVRGLVWRSALGLVADHALLGVGPGQFQAAFPPYRDAREIELSRHGVCSELDTEVEHAHNDWLQGFCELGLVGGGLLALGLALAARAALRALREPERLASAVAALALLVNAFVHAPLSANPASAALALGLFGTLAGEARCRSGRALGLLVALPLLCAAPFALVLVRHGLALTRAAQEVEQMSRMLGSPASVLRELRGSIDTEAALRTLDRPAEIAPDSVPALVFARGRNGEWAEILALRPHMGMAWEESATAAAERGAYAEAHARYLRALELSPTQPRLLRNLARLEWTQGDLALARETVSGLRERGCLAPEWLAELGAELVLEHGLPERGAELLHARPLAQLSPEELHAQSLAAAEGEGDADECLAQLLWAREHAARDDFQLALRNYRQAAERSHARRGPERGPAPLYALEQAAAEARAGHVAEARTRALGAGASAADWEALPEWAEGALLDLGLEAAR